MYKPKHVETQTY